MLSACFSSVSVDRLSSWRTGVVSVPSLNCGEIVVGTSDASLSALTVTSGNTELDGDITVQGKAVFADTTDATSPTTAAVVVDGGLSVNKSVRIGTSAQSTCGLTLNMGDSLKFYKEQLMQATWINVTHSPIVSYVHFLRVGSLVTISTPAFAFTAELDYAYLEMQEPIPELFRPSANQGIPSALVDGVNAGVFVNFMIRVDNISCLRLSPQATRMFETGVNYGISFGCLTFTSFYITWS
jgi:hypothetical protein